MRVDSTSFGSFVETKIVLAVATRVRVSTNTVAPRMVHTVFFLHHQDDSFLLCLPPFAFLLAGACRRRDGQKMLDHHVLIGLLSSRSRQAWLTAFSAQLFKTDLCTAASEA